MHPIAPKRKSPLTKLEGKTQIRLRLSPNLDLRTYRTMKTSHMVRNGVRTELFESWGKQVKKSGDTRNPAHQ